MPLTSPLIFTFPPSRSWAWMHGRTFSASDSGTLTRTFSPSPPVSSTLTCSQRSSARAVAIAAANVNTNRQQRPVSNPAPSPDSTFFMFVTSSLWTYCGNERPLPEVPNIFILESGISGISNLGPGLLRVGRAVAGAQDAEKPAGSRLCGGEKPRPDECHLLCD